MKQSKYNIYKYKKNGVFLINTLSGVVMNIKNSSILDKLNKVKMNQKVEMDSDIKKLCELGILVEEEENREVNEIINHYRQNELTITLFMTRQCNFRCVYCYEKFSDECMDKENLSSVLKFIQNYCLNHIVKKIRINLFGGEPLLNYSNIIYFLNDLKSYCECSDVLLSVGMTTNGYLLTKERYECLYNLGLSDTQITLDGFQPVHDKKRCLRNSGKTFNRITQNIDDICRLQKHSKILIRTNFDASSISSEKEFLAYLHNRYGDHIDLHFEAVKKWSKDYQKLVFNKKEEQDYTIELIRFCRENNIKNSYDSHLSYGRLSCVHALSNSFIIDSNMNVLKCTVDLENTNNVVGQLDDKGLITFNENLKLWNTSFEECNDCALLPICLKKRCPASIMQNKKKRCDYKENCQRYIDILDARYNAKR